jgi:hypothetical protein
MNSLLSPSSVRQLLILLIGVALLPLFAASACAAGPSVDAAMPILQANLIFDLVSDRARLVQVSLVFVALGCALIWWCK